MTDTEVPVLIVGGSLVGMTAALLLGHHGVRPLVVEYHRGTAIHPRAASVTQRTMEVFRSCGLEQAVRTKSEAQFVQDAGVVACETLAGGATAHYIANFNDLDTHWAAMGQLIAPQGAMVAIVGNQKPLPMDVVRSKSATLCWELMFTRPRFKTPDMIEQHRLLDQVADWLDSGKLRGTLKETLSPINAANLRKAHERLESGTMIGKLVLKGWQ